MQAIILAAGMGKRLKELTHDNTKCMVEVNGKTIIDRMLHQLDSKGLSRIVVVTGYKGDKLTKYIDSLGISTPICYIDNPIYDKTNNIYSLSLAKDYLAMEDSLLLESDIIFEDSVLDCLLDDPRETLALVDEYEPWMDGTCLKLDENDKIVDFISGRNFDFNNTQGCYKTVNIYKFSKHFSETRYIPFLDAYQKALGENEYYEQVLRVITMLEDSEITAKRLDHQKWYEIDDAQDLDIAEAIFCDDDRQIVEKIATRYGGYWRFTELLDYCYLVNPYYPPKKMIDEMKASFDRLLVDYPSGMSINSLLAAKNFGVKKEHIVVGNGAAELIKSLMERVVKGRIGIIRPTFEEYPNRYNGEVIVYRSDNLDFSYTADDIMAFYDSNKIDWLILINPDNPTGNYIPYDDLRRIIKWSRDNSIGIVVDESFVDFASENERRDVTLINENDLEIYDRLYVVKSISKSYGVPGLRLGVMAGSDVDTINQIKKDVAIWNINSFAEFYMQICEKYKKNYSVALSIFRETRKEFLDQLKQIRFISVFPSEANYVMCEVDDKIDVKELCAGLYIHNILIKDVTGKVNNGRQYIRLAVKRKEENEALVQVLHGMC